MNENALCTIIIYILEVKIHHTFHAMDKLESWSGPKVYLQPSDACSLFQWERVVLYLSTMMEMGPLLPRAVLLQKDEELAVHHVHYVDDMYLVMQGRNNVQISYE